jgi:PAS domain S-box-containing protein
MAKNTEDAPLQNGVQKEGEQLLNALADGLIDPLFLLKSVRNGKGQVTDFICTFINSAATTLLGLPREDILKRKFSEWFPVNHNFSLFDPPLLEQYAKVLESREITEGELSLALPNRQTLRLRQRITPFDEGVVVVFQPVIESEEVYRELADHVSDAFCELDGKLRYLYWNKAAERLTGITAKQALGKTVFEVFPELRGSSTERLFLETLRTQRPQRILNEYQVGNKTLFFEVNTYPSRRGVNVFMKDITYRKRSEEALKASKAHLSQILSTVDEVVFSYRVFPDGDFAYDYFSNAAKILWGFASEELIENKYLLVSRIPPESQEAFTHSLLKLVKQNEVVTLEYPFLHKDRSIRWIFNKLIPHLDQHGSLIVTGIAVDITIRKRTTDQIYSMNEILENQAATRTEELESLINAVPDPIFVVEQEGSRRISFCNTIFAYNLGFDSREQVQGKSIFECLPAADAERFSQQSRLVFDEGQVVHEQETVELTDGPRHFDTFKVPLRNAKGKVYALLGISHDITELVNARQALSTQTSQLENTNKELEAFSYSVSHDLRAPLRAIDGYTRILLEDYGDRIDVEGKRIIDIITGNAKKMGQLIDDLLDFSRLGRKELVKLNFNTNKLVDSVIADIKRQWSDDKNVIFNINSLEPSTGDVSMLKQVWVNLISNALKYSRNQDQARIEIGSFSQEGEYIFYVSDNGVGFDMQYSDKLFGVFQRLHTEEEFEGTGVGLAIAQRIIARHGGRIWGEGETGKGAIFYFALPKNY